MSEKIT